MRNTKFKGTASALLLTLVFIFFGLTTEAMAGDWQQNVDDIYYDAGNVGIGTSTPQAELDVDGRIRVKLQNFGGIYFGDTYKGLVWRLYNGGTPSITSNSLVVGTDDAITEIYWDTFRDGGWAFCEGTVSSGITVKCPDYEGLMGPHEYYWVWKHGADNRYPESADLKFVFDGESNDGVMGFMEDEDYFYFDDAVVFNDNVGIGTTAPNFKLEVDGTTDLGDTVTFGNGNWGTLSWGGSPEHLMLYGNANYGLGLGANGNNNDLYIATNGNVGIGTDSPVAKLHVSSDNGDDIAIARFDNGAGSDRIIIGAHDSNNEIKIDVPYPRHLLFLLGGTGDLNGADEVLRLTPSGNVGIGIANPDSKLHVSGNAHVTGEMIVDGNIAAKYQDLAEWVMTSEPVTPGTVVIIDTEKIDHIIPSDKAYNTLVAGVVSQQPGIALGEKGANKALVAHTGRVMVKVDTSNGAISTGDLLVASPLKGYAMRSEPVEIGGIMIHRPGTIIGKALEPLTEGQQGEVLALITLQ